MIKVVYYDDLNLVTDKEFDNETDARTFAASKDWARVIDISASRTISDITTPTP